MLTLDNLPNATPMTAERESTFADDIVTLSGFVVSTDHDGALKWLHELQFARVGILHAHYGVGHPFSAIISQRFTSLTAQTHLTAAMIANSVLQQSAWRTPAFWMGLIGAVTGVLGLIVAILAYLK